MAEDTRINKLEQFIKENSSTTSKNNNTPDIKKIGWFCTYTPEEIITAAGFMPFRVTGTQKAKKAEGYFPINFCPFIKSSMEDLLSISGNYSNISGLIFTNSCDGMRRFYDICKTYLPGIPSFLLDVPRIKSGPAIKQFTKNILNMSDFLTGLEGHIIEQKNLEDSLRLHTEKRALLKKLSSFFKESQNTVGIKNYFQILNYAMIEEPEYFITKLRKYLKDAESEAELFNSGSDINNNNNFTKNDIRKKDNPPVMVIGNFIDGIKLWEIFDDLKCRILASDTCSSERYFENIIDREEVNNIFNNGGFWENTYNKKDGANTEKIIIDIATRQLFKPQCMRMANLGAKIEEINKNIKKNKIRGVIFISQKFCDNTLLFYPLLRQDLNKLKIPSLFLEIEHNNLSSGQIKTRVQAFLEIL